jgi:hypothetical protein
MSETSFSTRKKECTDHEYLPVVPINESESAGDALRAYPLADRHPEDFPAEFHLINRNFVIGIIALHEGEGHMYISHACQLAS